MLERLGVIKTECETLNATPDSETPEQKVERLNKIDGLLTEGEKLQGDIEKEKTRAEKLSGINKTVETLKTTPVNGLPQGGITPTTEPKISFPGYSGKLACNSEADAYWTGVYYQYLSAAATNNSAALIRSEQKLKDHGHMTLAMSTINPATGGYLVPDVVQKSIIRLVEKRGVGRQAARMVPLSEGGENKFPRRTGGTTGYWVGEAAPTTGSTPTLDMVQLRPKKLSAKSTLPVELSEDGVINVGDWVAEELAYTFADCEDTAMFIGTGISSHGGIKGISKALIDAWTVSGGAGLFKQATGDEFSEIVRGDLVKTKSKLPGFARSSPNTKWYMHSTVFDTVVEALVLESGGTTSDHWANGAQPRLLGFPVEFVQVMPSTDADSQVSMILGDLRMGVYFGDRGGMWLRSSQEGDDFDNDTITVKGSERIDINCHGAIGTTPSVAGAFVGLISGT